MVRVALLCVLVGMGTRAWAAGEPLVPAVNEDFTVVDCGTPIRVLKLYAGTLYKHPETAKLHLLLEFGNNNGYRIGEQEWEDVWHRLVDVELESGQTRQTNGSDGVTSLHFLHPNGLIYLFEGKTHPASLGEYDPRSGKYRRVGALGDSPYKVVLAPSGRVYVGEVNGGVSVWEPAVRTLTHWDMPAGRKIHWGVYTMEVEEPWIYCGMTNQGKWFLTAIDTRTGKATSFFDVESGQEPAKAGGSSVTRTTAGNLFFGPYLLKDGQPQMDAHGNPLKLNPPGESKPDKSPPLEGNRSWPNMWKVAGYAGSRSKEAEEQLGIEFDLTDVEPNNWNGAVATVRWRKKGEAAWRTVQVKGLETVGMSTECLGVAPDGELIGVAAFYGSVFRFDPLTGASERLGLAPGSVYQILPTAGHTYFCGYVSFLADYDHSQPYLVHKDGTPSTNPKNFSTGVKWTHCMIQGPDGRIYLGGYDGRHRTGGGFSIFDPKTQEMKNLREPWFVHQGVRCLCLIHGGKTLAIATRPVGQNVPDPKGRIFLFDLQRQEIVREVVLDELPTNPDQLFVAGERAVIGVSRATEPDSNGREQDVTLVYGLDADSGKVLFQKRYPGRAFTGICRYDHTDVVRGPDGCGWLFVDQSLCRIHPDGTLESVRPQIDYRGKMLWHGKTLYIWNGGRVYSRLFANVVRIPDLFGASSTP